MSATPSRLGASRVAIFTDDPGWHGAQLKRALAERGCAGEYVSLTACRFDLSGDGAPIRIPGFGDFLPDGAFVRGVPGGSLEEVVFYLDILHALQELGLTVYNDARAIERTVDKGMTSFLLRRSGIPTPPTWVTRDPEEARAIILRELRDGQQMVSKPLFGSQGEGLQRLQRVEDLTELMSSNGVYYLQRFVDCGDQPFHDWRVFVIAGRAVAAMRRNGQTWLNNVAQGARCEAAKLDAPWRELAEDAVRVVGMGYAGVDIIRDAGGALSVIEVNSVPAWKGLQSVTEARVAELLAEDFLTRCGYPATREKAA
ncbi:MAG TPA: RimK family alpha-L-glutamate ligase [Methylococcaceae bacterium]|nr:RimK family alpha-L-glutamate ligase [Methylococcaceae bacterium]